MWQKGVLQSALIRSGFFIIPLFLSAVIFLPGLLPSTASAAEPKFRQGENGRVKGFDKIDPSMFKAKPLNNRFFAEEWFHEFQSKDQGIMINVSFALNNLGIETGYCDTYISVSDESSGRLMDKAIYSPKDVKIDKDGFGITVGENRIELAGDEYHILYRGKQIQADLTYKILAPSFRQGEGITYFADSNDFVQSSYPISYASVSGTVTYNNKTVKVKGLGHMSHDWQVLSPLRYISRWRTLWLYSDNFALGIVRGNAEGFGEEWVERLMLAEQGKILFTSHDFKYEIQEFREVPGFDVGCPSRIVLEAKHGEDWIKGEITLKSINEQWAILEDYSPIIRKIADLVIDDAASYRYWVDCRIEYNVDGEMRKINGKGVGLFVESIKAK